jgi:hypothetical protein
LFEKAIDTAPPDTMTRVSSCMLSLKSQLCLGILRK